MPQEPRQTPLSRAAKIVGSPTELARLIGRSQSTVWGWLQRGWPAPEACEAIEKATDGKISRFDLLQPVMSRKRRRSLTTTRGAPREVAA